MQISTVIAAENWSSDFTQSDDVVVKRGVVARPGGLIVNMKKGNDQLQLGRAGGKSFDGTFGKNAGIDGGAGNDALILTGQSVLTVSGRTTLESVEKIVNDGIINANGGLDFLGTAGNDGLSYQGGGRLTVAGKDFNVNTLDGDDSFRIRGGSVINVDGQDANIAGGLGDDSFVNAGTLRTRNGGSIDIGGFETVENSEVLIVDGNFASTGTAGVDTFTNSGTLTVDGRSDIGMKGGDDRIVNTGNMKVGKVAVFDGGKGTGDELSNAAGAIITVTGRTKIVGVELVQNAGTINANGGLDYLGSAADDALVYGGNGKLKVSGGGFNVKTQGGDDSFETKAGSTITVTGADANFDGGSGRNTLTNGGTVATLNGGNIAINNFQTTANDGSFKADGNFGYTGTAGKNSFTNNGSLTARGTGTFNFGSGNDTLTNAGTVDFAGAGNVRMGDGKDTLTNSRRMEASAWDLDGGAGLGDSLSNSGNISGGTIAISGFEEVTNGKTIRAVVGGITYDGSGNNDTFTNSATGVVNSQTAASFDFGGGNDKLKNDGAIVVQTGNASFDGGTGTNIFSNKGSLESKTGDVEIDNFQTTVNDGEIVAGGKFDYAGTDGIDSFTNRESAAISAGTGASFSFGDGNDTLRNDGAITVQNGNAKFDGGIGTNSFTNNGEVTTVAGGDIILKNFQTVVNNGNSFDAAGNFSFSGTAAADSFTNNGSIAAGGTGTFGFGGGNDSFTNDGRIDLAGAGEVSMGGGTDTLTNTKNMSAASWELDGGPGTGDELKNTGKIAGRSIAISGFETVTNRQTIRAETGGVTYTGTDSGDSFINGAKGVVSSQTASSFDFGGGNDTLTNTGAIIVKSGNASFDGGTGTDNSFTNNGDVTARTGDIVISNFQEVENNGNSFDAAGDFDYTGTAGDDTFTNNGSLSAGGKASFDGLAGADTFDNSGTMLIRGGGSTISNFETVTNSSRMEFNTLAATPAGPALLVDGDFTNAAGGFLDVRQAGDNRFGDVIDVQGIFASVATSFVQMNTKLTEGGDTDLFKANSTAGQVNLDINFEFGDNKELFGADRGTMLIADTGGSIDAFVKINGRALIEVTEGADAGVFLSDKFGRDFNLGLIDYYLRNVGGDVFVESVLDTDKASSVVGGLASAVASMSALFHKPISAFVSVCKPTDADGKGFGTWGRGTIGSLDTDLGDAYRTDYSGLQSGLDIASCDTGGGTTYHAGLLTGYVTGNTEQQDALERLNVHFDSKFIGAYAALLDSSGFTGDATVRYDFHNFDLSHPDTSVIARGTNIQGSTISAAVGGAYTLPLSDTVFIRPGLGLLVGNTAVDSFTSPSASFDFEDQLSIMGTASLTAQALFSLNDSANVLVFVNGSVFNEFGGDPSSTIGIPGSAVTIDSNISNVGTFSQISTGVTLLAKGGEAISQPDFTGTMRFDAQIGEKLEGWGLTAQFRMQF